MKRKLNLTAHTVTMVLFLIWALDVSANPLNRNYNQPPAPVYTQTAAPTPAGTWNGYMTNNPSVPVLTYQFSGDRVTVNQYGAPRVFAWKLQGTELIFYPTYGATVYYNRPVMSWQWQRGRNYFQGVTASQNNTMFLAQGGAVVQEPQEDDFVRNPGGISQVYEIFRNAGDRAPIALFRLYTSGLVINTSTNERFFWHNDNGNRRVVLYLVERGRRGRNVSSEWIIEQDEDFYTGTRGPLTNHVMKPQGSPWNLAPAPSGLWEVIDLRNNQVLDVYRFNGTQARILRPNDYVTGPWQIRGNRLMIQHEGQMTRWLFINGRYINQANRGLELRKR